MCRGLKAKSRDRFNSLKTGKSNISFSETEPGLTQDFDLHWLAAVELGHTLNLSEGHMVPALKAVTGLIQACHHTWIVLDGPQQSRCQSAQFTTLLRQQGNKKRQHRQTLVIMDIMALRGCSPLVSYTTMSSPKSQKSCLQRAMDQCSYSVWTDCRRCSEWFLPKESTSVSNDQLYSFVVTKLSQLLLFLQSGVG